LAERRSGVRWVLCLCAVAAIPFLPALGGAFTNWDDDVNVTNNLFVHAGVRDGLLPLLTKPYWHLYVPVTYALFWAAHHLWDDAAIGYHLLNLACHLVAAALFYQILNSILKSRWAAALASAWWALQPLQVEPVAWITGLKDVLSGMLALASWRLYVAWREQPARPPAGGAGSGRRLLFCASALAFLLACLAKPNVVLFPVVLVGYDLLIRQRKWRELAPLAFFIAVSALTALVTLKVQRPEQGGVQLPQGAAPRLLIAADSAAFYLEKFLWPASLSPDYGRSLEHGLRMPAAGANVAALCAAALVVLCLGRRWWLAATVFVAGWGPISGLVAFGYLSASSVADRYAYLPALGAALAVGDLISRFDPAREGSPEWPGMLARGLACLWILVFGVLTWSQTAVWRNSVTVWEKALNSNPHPSARVLANYGSALYRRSQALSRDGRQEEARRTLEDASNALRRCVSEYPRHAPGHYNLALVLQAQGRYEAARAECATALGQDPPRPDWWVALGAIDAAMKDYDGCADASERALSLDPRNAMAALNLGLAELELHRPVEAAKALGIAVGAAPEDYEARFHLAVALEMSGRPAEALAEFFKVASAPADKVAPALRADASAQAGRLARNGQR
jgi:tetratricopeptide (TPR) repeat protein